MLVTYKKEMGRMDTQSRVDVYSRQARITPRMQRRLVKKAGRDPMATVVRDQGMGFSPARQGERVLVGYERRPVE